MDNWEDWHLILAIARGGSLAQAARDLNLDYSTVFRRLKQIEAALGCRLFDRSRSHCQATEAGRHLVEAGQTAREAFDAALLDIAGSDTKLSGQIRFTTIGSLAESLLTPMLARFRKEHPEIRVELNASLQNLNLYERESDVALRFTRHPPEQLIGSQVATAATAVYASPEYLARHPDACLSQLDWIVPTPDIVAAGELRWVARYARAENTALVVNSGQAGMQAALAHMGVCALIAYLGEPNGLVRITPPINGLDTQLWLLTHPSLRNLARIRVFMQALREELKACQPMLRCETGLTDLRENR